MSVFGQSASAGKLIAGGEITSRGADDRCQVKLWR